MSRAPELEFPLPIAGFGAAAFRELGLYMDEAFLASELCREIAAAARSAERAEPATLYSTESGYVDETIRRTRKVRLPKALRQAVHDRFEQARPQVARHFGQSLSSVEAPEFLRYGVGDFFKVHRDSGHGSLATRRVSAVVFLNSEGYAGGDLRLYGLLKGEKWAGVGLPVTPKAGSLVAFASTLVHEVQPVTAGERLTVVTWFHE